MHKASSGEIEILRMEEGDLREVLLIEKKSFVAPWSRQLFEETLAFPLAVNLVMKMDKKVIGYCGGGISATVDLFLLHQLGYEDLALYDGSMGEWAKDASLPIETD